MAAALKALMDTRGVSEAHLARMAGVSRRRVFVALAGGDITIDVLKRLMRALSAETLPLGDLSTASDAGVAVDGAVLVSAADQIERGVDLISAAAISLRKRSERPSCMRGVE